MQFARILSKSLQPSLARRTFLPHRCEESSRLWNRSVYTQIKAEKAIIFKNGHGLITSHIELPHDKTSAEMPLPPSATKNSVWVTPPSDKISVASVNTVLSDDEEEEFCTTVGQLLQANMTKVLELHIDGKDWFIGRVASVQLGTDPPGPTQRGLVLLQNEKGTTTLPIARVTSVRMPLHPPPEFRSADSEEKDQVLSTLLMKTTQNTHLQVHYKSQAAETVTGQVSYLSKGLFWTPNYRILIDTSSKSSQLSFEAIISNTIDDIYVENLVCSSGAALMNTGSVSRADDDDALLHYHFKDISINNNETVALPILNANLSFTEVFHVDIKDNRPGVVYRALKTRNNTAFPWAKGDVLIRKDNFFATYQIPCTPVGEEAVIPFSESTDVSVGVGEKSATITNAKENTATVVVRKFLSGGSKRTMEVNLGPKEQKDISF